MSLPSFVAVHSEVVCHSRAPYITNQKDQTATLGQLKLMQSLLTYLFKLQYELRQRASVDMYLVT